jgi:Recombination endonuclease VII
MDLKRCTKCGTKKDASMFYRDQRRICGLRARCKVCTNKAHEEYVHRSYGIDFEAVPPKPSVCDLCKRGGKMCLDHDHETGKFRGWLCDGCNRGLGLLQDSPILLRQAADYIERSK